MAAELPEVGREEFGQRLEPLMPGEAAPAGCDSTKLLVDRLYEYYQELRRWSPRLALVGSGTAEVAVERHFGESLAGLPLLPRCGRLVDLGSGAGFPGLVLAVAAPSVRCTLVESRLRKTAFLRAAARRMRVRAEIVRERVSLPLSTQLPETIDCLTARAVRLPAPVWDALFRRLEPGGRALVWAGRESPVDSGRLELVREVSLPPSESRRILYYRKPSV